MNIRIILLIALLGLLGFLFILGLGSREETVSANSYDVKSVPMETRKTQTVMVNLSPNEFTAVDYDFDERYSYRLKAQGGEVEFSFKFKKGRSADPRIKLILALRENAETHFWPWNLRKMQARGQGKLIIRKVEDPDIPENHVWGVAPIASPVQDYHSDYIKAKYTLRRTGIYCKLGDLWVIDNRENIRLTPNIDTGYSGADPNAQTFYICFGKPGQLNILVPKGSKENLDITVRLWGHFGIVQNDGTKIGGSLR